MYPNENYNNQVTPISSFPACYLVFYYAKLHFLLINYKQKFITEQISTFIISVYIYRNIWLFTHSRDNESYTIQIHVGAMKTFKYQDFVLC